MSAAVVVAAAAVVADSYLTRAEAWEILHCAKFMLSHHDLDAMPIYANINDVIAALRNGELYTDCLNFCRLVVYLLATPLSSDRTFSCNKPRAAHDFILSQAAKCVAKDRPDVMNKLPLNNKSQWIFPWYHAPHGSASAPAWIGITSAGVEQHTETEWLHNTERALQEELRERSARAVTEMDKLREMSISGMVSCAGEWHVCTHDELAVRLATASQPAVAASQ